MLTRTIIEKSCMINNDEIVVHKELDEPAEHGQKVGAKDALDPFDDPYVRVSRPVFTEEIEAGLDTSYNGQSFDEKPPDVTWLLDSYYRLRHYFHTMQQITPEPDPTFDIAMYVAHNYYDCMSGGMPTFDIVVILHLCSSPDINLDEPVYPGKDRDYEPKNQDDYKGWYTLRDFVAEFDGKLESFESMLHRLRKKLPQVLPMLEAHDA